MTLWQSVSPCSQPLSRCLPVHHTPPVDPLLGRVRLFISLVSARSQSTLSLLRLAGGRRDNEKRRVFVVADIPCAIIGVTFLAAFDLLVHCHQSRLHDKILNLNVRGLQDLPEVRRQSALRPSICLRHTDDLLVASSTAEEHMEHLAMVFDRLQQFNVVPNPSKCSLGVSFLEFLGHLVDCNGIHPLPSKVSVIREFPPPSSKRQLQRFLDIRHIDGSSNEVAGAVSSPSIAQLHRSPDIDVAELAAEQHRVGSPCDEDVSRLQFQELLLTTDNDTILCDVFIPPHRPFLPPSIDRKVLSSLHNLSHPDSQTTDKLVSDRFVWLYPHPDDSLSPGGHHGGRAVSLPAEGFPTRRGRYAELDGPPSLVLLGIRSSLKLDLDCSAAELVFGATVLLPV
ncbi:hypothetical protein SprV_0100203400 [Sparganum proliferum]